MKFLEFLDKLSEQFETPTKPEKKSNTSKSMLQQRFTQEIVTTDPDVLVQFINQYNDGKKQDLIDLFEGNSVLAQWIVEKASAELFLKLPVEIRDMIDDILS